MEYSDLSAAHNVRPRLGRGPLTLHFGWIALLSLVIGSSLRGTGLPQIQTPLAAREVLLVLLVEVEASGVSLRIRNQASGGVLNAPFASGLPLMRGHDVWLAEIGLGVSSRELGRTARAIVQQARLDRGAMASHVRVSIHAGRGIGWSDVHAAREAIERGLEGRPGFDPPASLRIALRTGARGWPAIGSEFYLAR